MHADVLIVGGGPVGLFLAGLLVDRGVDAVVLERSGAPRAQSRAIGLHPPALDALATLGLDGVALAEGTVVRRGIGYGDGRLLGAITFDRAHPRFPFVLTLPQARTEALLTAHLERVAPGTLRRGVEVVGMEDPGPCDGRSVRVSVRSAGSPVGEAEGWSASVVVGADGAHSTVRRLAGIGVDRREWGDSYLMGDFAEESEAEGAEPTAVIHLHRHGVVESFPLPGGQRRWVVHTGQRRRPEHAQELVGMLRERWPPGGSSAPGDPGDPGDPGGAGAPDGSGPPGVPGLPDPASATMVSAFTVYRQLSRRMIAGRTVLIGDAAHAISPFGGQGMTLGWLDALALAPLLAEEMAEALPGALTGEGAGPASGTGLRKGLDQPAFREFERQRKRAALMAARTAEANMLLGRPLPVAALAVRDLAARAVLATPLRHALARQYTMNLASRPARGT
ncbi:FAD-dependent oxidoreductase [Citricoccus nitrophenolicus]|uniref:FAD-dependent oxidoreductase n=1 Tax=Citricoccus nitrophenolicus TaxID=863575 RepID=UPI0039B585D6